MLQTLLITAILTAIAIILLGVKVFFVKNGKFPETHVGNNPAMKERGITCAKSQDKEAQSSIR